MSISQYVSSFVSRCFHLVKPYLIFLSSLVFFFGFAKGFQYAFFHLFHAFLPQITSAEIVFLSFYLALLSIQTLYFLVFKPSLERAQFDQVSANLQPYYSSAYLNQDNASEVQYRYPLKSNKKFFESIEPTKDERDAFEKVLGLSKKYKKRPLRSIMLAMSLNFDFPAKDGSATSKNSGSNTDASIHNDPSNKAFQQKLDHKYEAFDALAFSSKKNLPLTPWQTILLLFSSGLILYLFYFYHLNFQLAILFNALIIFTLPTLLFYPLYRIQKAMSQIKYMQVLTTDAKKTRQNNAARFLNVIFIALGFFFGSYFAMSASIEVHWISLVQSALSANLDISLTSYVMIFLYAKFFAHVIKLFCGSPKISQKISSFGLWVFSTFLGQIGLAGMVNDWVLYPLKQIGMMTPFVNMDFVLLSGLCGAFLCTVVAKYVCKLMRWPFLSVDKEILPDISASSADYSNQLCSKSMTQVISALLTQPALIAWMHETHSRSTENGFSIQYAALNEEERRLYNKILGDGDMYPNQLNQMIMNCQNLMRGIYSIDPK